MGHVSVCALALFDCDSEGRRAGSDASIILVRLRTAGVVPYYPHIPSMPSNDNYAFRLICFWHAGRGYTAKAQCAARFPSLYN